MESKPTMDNRGKNMQRQWNKIMLKSLLDCYLDFYLPTLHKRTILRRLHQNMLDGQCDASFMSDETNQRHLMGGGKFQTNGLYHDDTGCVLYVKSWCHRQSLAIGIDGNFHWKCDVITDNHAVRASKRQFTPEGLKRSWIRAFPSIKREIRKLKRCHTCQKRVQAHTRCESCVMAG